VGPDRQRVLEEGARREGQLMLYTSSTSIEPMADAFMRKYPFVKMEVYSTRSEPLTQRTLAESRAGRLNGDVFKSNIFVWDDLKDILVKFNSPSARFDRAPNAASADVTGIVFMFHATRVAPSDIPQRVEDLLQPRWRGNLALHGPPNNFAGRWTGMLLEHLGEPATRDFLRRLGEQRPFLFNNSEVARNGILAGEFDLSSAGLADGVRAIRNGDPIRWTLLDPSTLSPDILGFFRQAPHPYAAMLFLDWVTAPEGQQAMAEAQGSIGQADLQKGEKDGVKIPPRLTYQSAADATKLEGWMTLFEETVARR
jgi:iron(III) transport system substrate-binding protein